MCYTIYQSQRYILNGSRLGYRYNSIHNASEYCIMATAAIYDISKNVVFSFRKNNIWEDNFNWIYAAFSVRSKIFIYFLCVF